MEDLPWEAYLGEPILYGSEILCLSSGLIIVAGTSSKFVKFMMGSLRDEN